MKCEVTTCSEISSYLPEIGCFPFSILPVWIPGNIQCLWRRVILIKKRAVSWSPSNSKLFIFPLPSLRIWCLLSPSTFVTVILQNNSFKFSLSSVYKCGWMIAGIPGVCLIWFMGIREISPTHHHLPPVDCSLQSNILWRFESPETRAFHALGCFFFLCCVLFTERVSLEVFALCWASLLWLWDLPSMRTVLRAVSSCFRVWVFFLVAFKDNITTMGFLGESLKQDEQEHFWAKALFCFGTTESFGL